MIIAKRIKDAIKYLFNSIFADLMLININTFKFNLVIKALIVLTELNIS